MTTQTQTTARPAAADLDAATVAEIVGLAELGMPIGPSLALRLCADWRRMAAELARLTAPAPVPAADVPPFLAHRVNGGKA